MNCIKTHSDSGNGPDIGRAESNLGVAESTEVRNPLDIYCSEIRRLNNLNPEDEQRFQVLMSEISDSLVRTISRFPGSARILIEGCKTSACSLLSSPTNRRDGECDHGESSAAPWIDEISLMECEDNEEFDDRVARTDLAQGIPDSDLIQAVSARLDGLYQAARRYGISHETTRKHRLALSEAFRKLPLTPLCIENLIARLNSLLESWQQTRLRRSAEGTSHNELAEAMFEQLYAIGFEEFEQIARESFRLYFEWQKIRNRIAEFHVGLVVYLARQYSSEPQELIDLIQEGNIGLIKAVERFKYRLGFRFSTYATYWIRLSMSRHLARSSRAVRLPYRQSLYIGTVRKQREIFSQIHGRAPNTLELARVTGISEAGLRKLEIISQAIASLDAQVEPGEPLDLLSMLEQQVFNQPLEEVERQDMNGLIEQAIGGLNQREAYVIRQRFGIGVYTEKTLQELGAVLGLTRERVRQIENGALKKIRRWFEPLTV
ncbi:MAG: RNA polymerase sigma factor RpoD/SigA [Methylococcaceae bacterium]|nr:RNA polymerase sigma factor RpoD/SigA [Methylococcaceae bacterium]MCI0668468.1 RNA polymerase sigma factor RpoD/SigA [Methylococcaceae bacterium]MCI0733340.1 RNA polymerase sigma factor RpoD/SigA [Methylococcaceae bacterium]